MEAGLERIDALMSVKPLPTNAEPPQSIYRFDIGFEDVDFAYNSTLDSESDRQRRVERRNRPASNGQHEPVLRDVSFKLPEKSLTALVSPSGSGKTTITKLISRYADP